MNDIIAARSQMALSMIFHIVFSCIGMTMPFFMAVANLIYLRTGNPVYKNVTVAWSKGVAIFFATGAVSGTVLSFELGLLWPGFMKEAGPIIGMPFSLEGTAFFIEAIALGFYLYGWQRLNRWFHWMTGLLVGLTGIASGILVVSANSWMNDPAGFDFVQNKFIHVDPYRAMFNKAWFEEALHMSIAAFAATGFAVAGVHAFMILKRKNVEFHSTGFRIAAIFGCIAALLQPFSGDLSARFVAEHQPAKLAAMEAHFKTQKRAPLIIGGIPNVKNKTVKYGLEIPALLSVMVYGDPQAEVTGLDKIPVEKQPPVPVVHYAFQIMVALGMAMLSVSLVYFIALFWRRAWFGHDWIFKLFALLTPFGFIAVESGWIVTEVGRQPWIIQGFMTTAEALTPMPGIKYTFYLFMLVYISLAFTVVFLLYRQIKMVPVKYDRYN